MTCSVSLCPASSGPPGSASQPGSSLPPVLPSRHPTASPSPATRHSVSPAPGPAPPAWCMWSSVSQGSRTKERQKTTVKLFTVPPHINLVQWVRRDPITLVPQLEICSLDIFIG